ncbi:MAG: LamG domain-containing protein, partial [Candidatus Anstonellales archaeon]
EQIALFASNQTNVISFRDTHVGSNYSLCVYANDGYEENSTCTENITIPENKPTISATLSTALNLNTTQENLTATVVASGGNREGARDHIEIIYEWKEDGITMALMNLPFEGNDGFELQTTKNYGRNKSLNITPYARGYSALRNPPWWNFTTGYNGSGAYFFENAKENYLLFSNIDTSELPYGNQNFTYMAWVNLTSSGGNGYIYTQHGTGGNNMSYLYAQPTATTFAYMRDGDLFFSTISGPGIPLNQWHHIAVTYDGVTIRLYVDGVETERIIPGPLSQPKDYLKIGSRDIYGDFDGHIDNFEVYDRALSPEQIAAIAANRSDRRLFRGTKIGHNYSLCVYANDGYEENSTCTGNITIVPNPPDIEGFINSSLGKNTSRENLIANITVVDEGNNETERDYVENIVDWRLNGKSIAVLYLPFEGIDGNESFVIKNYGRDKTITLRPAGRLNTEGTGAPLPTLTKGHNGSGSYYFGVNQDSFLYLPDATGVLPSGDVPFAMDAWVYINGSSGYIYGIYRNSTHYTGLYYTANSLRFNYMVSGDSFPSTLTYNSGNLQGAWHHVGVSYNGLTLRMFLDGVQVASVVPGVLDQPNDTLRIGALENSTETAFNGFIDDFRFYDMDIKAGQMALYASSKPYIIHSSMTHKDENWSFCAYGNDGFEEDSFCSENMTILSGGLWATIYGNVSGNITLAAGSAANQRFYQWTWNGHRGMVYVANSDATIDWGNLIGLGLGATDFEDADAVLGTSDYVDNINYTFSIDGTNAKNTTSSYMYGRFVQYPIYPSSADNCTTTWDQCFVTGIVWDFSDDTGNAEFDPADAEDIVFISPIMKGTEGGYGTYDYEIIVPETLDTYTGSSGTVSIWVELN